MSRRYRGILFDLDGTLIGLDVGDFIPAYFEDIARFVARWDGDPEEFLRRLREATRAMIGDADPETTNREVFEAHFFCGIEGAQRAREEACFEVFYRLEFPKLRRFCEPIPGADVVLRMLDAGGLRRVLATNPLFPRVAIETRLRWGGLAPEEFETLTTYENSRFCKPNPQYFAAIAADMGLAPEEVLMVGNDPVEDMVASEIGMDTFLVNHYVVPRPDVMHKPTYRGALEDIPGLVLEGRVRGIRTGDDGG